MAMKHDRTFRSPCSASKCTVKCYKWKVLVPLRLSLSTSICTLHKLYPVQVDDLLSLKHLRAVSFDFSFRSLCFFLSYSFLTFTNAGLEAEISTNSNNKNRFQSMYTAELDGYMLISSIHRCLSYVSEIKPYNIANMHLPESSSDLLSKASLKSPSPTSTYHRR